MELTNQRPSRRLAGDAIQGRPRRTQRSNGGSSIYEAPAHKQRVRMCKCGTCLWCRENERWERIFQEKFADPNYYLRSAIRYDSPLNAICL
jgi:hypothetical protein